MGSQPNYVEVFVVVVVVVDIVFCVFIVFVAVHIGFSYGHFLRHVVIFLTQIIIFII